MTGAIRALASGALIAGAALSLSACGGRVATPHGAASRVVVREDGRADTTGSSGATVSSTQPGDGPGTGSLPTLPAGRAHPATTPTSVVLPKSAAADPTQKAILTAYESYLLALSGLDDNLSEPFIGPVAAVTTNRLAQASVRQAASLLAAQEHGVGTLRDDHVTVVMTGPASAALADCQDEKDFYLVDDNSGTPDPFIGRGDYAGSAQMVLQDGHWLVDVFTTTHVTCAY